MLSNRSSGTEEDGGSGIRMTGSGIRKLTKRKGDDRPKISRLGATKVKSGDGEPVRRVVRSLGSRNDDAADGGRTSDSFVGSDSERSERSVADEWNARPVTKIAEEQPWTMSDSSEWEKVSIEPPFTKKHAYKCGPVGDEDVPRSFPRLQAPGSRSQFGDEAMIDNVKVQKQQQHRPTQELSPERELSLDEKFPEPQQPSKPQPSPSSGGWSLRNSWLGSVSKSVASLTTQLTQNLASPTNEPPKEAKEDFRALIAERMKQDEDSRPKTGRKYLHKVGIDESFTQQPSFGYQETEPEPRAKKNLNESIEDAVLQQSTKLTSSSRPLTKNKQSSADKTAAFLQQEAVYVAPVPPKLQPTPQPVQKSTPLPSSTLSTKDTDAWDDWSNDDFETVDIPVPQVETKRNSSVSSTEKVESKPIEKSAAVIQAAPIEPKPLTPQPPVDPEIDSWNDWDQEMEVEPAEVVLETPVTQMHITTQSSTPPRTVDDEVVHGAPQFAIQSVLEEVLDDQATINDPAKIKELPEEEKKEIERKIQDSLHIEVSKYYENDSTHEWDEDEEVDWGTDDQKIEQPLIEASMGHESEIQPELQPGLLPIPEPIPQNLNSSTESIASETKDVPYEQLNEEPADEDNDGWGDGWDNEEPELDLQEITPAQEEVPSEPVQLSNNTADLPPPPFTPTEKAELERKIKLSLESVADKFFQATSTQDNSARRHETTNAQDDCLDWATTNWKGEYNTAGDDDDEDDDIENVTTPVQTVPLFSSSKVVDEELKRFRKPRDAPSVPLEGERNIVFGDEDSLRFEVSSDGIGEDGRSFTGSLDSRSDIFLSEKTRDQVDDAEIEVEPVIVKKFAYKCGSDDDDNDELGKNVEEVKSSTLEVSESVAPPLSSIQVESSPPQSGSGWDDWSEPDQDESSDDAEIDPHAPPTEPRKQSKQKSVEECIQLLIENRQKLAQQLEDHQRHRMGTEETLDQVQDSLVEGNRQADELESLQQGDEIHEPTIEMQLSPQSQSQLNFNWNAEVEEVTTPSENLLCFDENIKMIPIETMDYEPPLQVQLQSSNLTEVQLGATAPTSTTPSDNLAPTPSSSNDKPLNEAEAFALSSTVNEAAPLFEVPQESEVDVPNITKITWNYVEGEPPLTIEGGEESFVLTENEKKLQDYLFQQGGGSLADWIQGKTSTTVTKDETVGNQESIASEIQTVQPSTVESVVQSSDWQSWEDDEEELNIIVGSQVVVPLPLLDDDEVQPEISPIPTTRTAEPDRLVEGGRDEVEEVISAPKAGTQNESAAVTTNTRRFRNPEYPEEFDAEAAAKLELPQPRDESNVLFDIENQINSVPFPFKPPKPIAISGERRESETEAVKSFAYSCGSEDEKPGESHLDSHEVDETIESRKEASQVQSAAITSATRRFRNPEHPETFTAEPQSQPQPQHESDVLFDIESQINSVEFPFEPPKPVAIPGERRDSEPTSKKRFAYSCGSEDENENESDEFNNQQLLPRTRLEPIGADSDSVQVATQPIASNISSALPTRGELIGLESNPEPRSQLDAVKKFDSKRSDTEVNTADAEEDAWDDWEESESFETKSREGDGDGEVEVENTGTLTLKSQKVVIGADAMEPTIQEESDYDSSDDDNDDDDGDDEEDVDEIVVPIEEHHLGRSKEVENLTTEPEDDDWCEDEKNSFKPIEPREPNEPSNLIRCKEIEDFTDEPDLDPPEEHHMQRSKEVQDLTVETDDDENWAEKDDKNLAAEPVESLNQPKDDESSESSDNAGWNDDWGDEDDEGVVRDEEKCQTEESTKAPLTSLTAKASEKDDDNEGWDDFDIDSDEELTQEPMAVKQSTATSTTSKPVCPPPGSIETMPPPPPPDQAIPNVFDRLEKKNQWDWKSTWGVSLLANASKNVASLTAQVSQNLTSALETGIVPPPEEMARLAKTEELNRQPSLEPRSRKESVESKDRRISSSSTDATESRERATESRERKESFRESSIEELPRKVSSGSIKTSDRESSQSRKSSVASSGKAGDNEKAVSDVAEGWDDDESWGDPVPEPTLDSVKPSEQKQFDALPRINPLKSLTSKKIIGLDHIVSGVTQIGSKVITGGLDTLEGIGKKTITIINDKDSGIITKTKQFVIDKDRKVLSDVLNEAKIENADPVPIQRRKEPEFDIMFDDFQGYVYLEALKILARQAEIKIGMLLQPLEGVAYETIKGTIDEVGELFQLPELSDIENPGDHTVAQLEDRLIFAVRDLEVEIKLDDLAETWKQALLFLTRQAHKMDSKDVYERAFEELAKFSAMAIGKLRQLADMLSVCEYHSTAGEIDALMSLLTTFCWHISGIATRFNKVLSQKEKTDETTTYMSNIFLEASTATTHLKHAYSLFKPILQIAAA